MWMKEVFGTDKPVIGMLHLMALPTDPKYDEKGGIQAVIDRAREDVHALQDGGIDGILFCNEFSIPYTDNVRVVTIACMARIIGELLSEIKVPFGVDVAMDPYKVFDLAAASVQQGEIERHRVDVGCKNVYTLATLVPEGAKQIAERPIEDVAKSVTFSIAPGALLVYGNNAGAQIDTSNITRAKSATSTPVFASNGVKAETVENILSISDGCVVGTWLKYDGYFYNKVDKDRVKQLMDKAKAFRGNN